MCEEELSKLPLNDGALRNGGEIHWQNQKLRGDWQIGAASARNRLMTIRT